MTMPRPSPEQRMLERLVGKWSGSEKNYPSPWDPTGGAAQAIIENRLMIDGFAVLQEYKQIRGGKTSFEGLGIMRYDTEARVRDALARFFRQPSQ